MEFTEIDFEAIKNIALESNRQIAEIKSLCKQIQENNEKLIAALNYMNGKPNEDPLEVSKEIMANDDVEF